MDNNFEKLKEIIKKFTGDDENITINSETNLLEDLNFDSISIISFIICVEEIFGINFDYDDLHINIIGNVGVVYDYIKSKIEDLPVTRLH